MKNCRCMLLSLLVSLVSLKLDLKIEASLDDNDIFKVTLFKTLDSIQIGEENVIVDLKENKNPKLKRCLNGLVTTAERSFRINFIYKGTVQYLWLYYFFGPVKFNPEDISGKDTTPSERFKNVVLYMPDYEGSKDFEQSLAYAFMSGIKYELSTNRLIIDITVIGFSKEQNLMVADHQKPFLIIVPTKANFAYQDQVIPYKIVVKTASETTFIEIEDKSMDRVKIVFDTQNPQRTSDFTIKILDFYYEKNKSTKPGYGTVISREIIDALYADWRTTSYIFIGSAPKDYEVDLRKNWIESKEEKKCYTVQAFFRDKDDISSDKRIKNCLPLDEVALKFGNQKSYLYTSFWANLFTTRFKKKDVNNNFYCSVLKDEKKPEEYADDANLMCFELNGFVFWTNSMKKNVFCRNYDYTKKGWILWDVEFQDPGFTNDLPQKSRRLVM